MRILVVEDDNSLSLAITTILSKNFKGYEIRSVGNGKKAYDILVSELYDLVVCDWNLPEMSGKDLLIAIRSHKMIKDLPLIFVTARSDRESVVSAMELGIDAYITKPFTMGALIEKVRKTLGIEDY